MIPSNKIKISELPQASGSEISQLDVLHLVKYPQKEGRKVQLVDLQSYFNSFSGSIGYVLSPSGSNTPYTSSYSYSSSYTNTASYAAYVSTASYALNVKNINSSSFVVTASGANSNSTASFALTAKQALTSSYFSSFNGSGSITGSAGTIVQFLLTNINGVNYKIPLYGI